MSEEIEEEVKVDRRMKKPQGCAIARMPNAGLRLYFPNRHFIQDLLELGIDKAKLLIHTHRNVKKAKLEKKSPVSFSIRTVRDIKVSNAKYLDVNEIASLLVNYGIDLRVPIKEGEYYDPKLKGTIRFINSPTGWHITHVNGEYIDYQNVSKEFLESLRENSDILKFAKICTYCEELRKVPKCQLESDVC